MAKRALKPTEHQEQAAVVEWFQSYARTKGIDPRLLIAIPNSQILMGSARNKHAVMAYLRAEGFADAAPDLLLAWPKPMIWYGGGTAGISISGNFVFCGLFLEMKRKGGKPSKDQLFMADLLRRAGYSVVIAYGADEASRAIKAYIET